MAFLGPSEPLPGQSWGPEDRQNRPKNNPSERKVRHVLLYMTLEPPTGIHGSKHLEAFRGVREKEEDRHYKMPRWSLKRGVERVWTVFGAMFGGLRHREPF